MPAIGFLHTADVHLNTFHDLLAEVAPDLSDVAVADADLLSDARRSGVEAVRGRLLDRLEELAAQSVDVIVCTCSTLGGEAESLGPVRGIPVIRADRPMAEAAVAEGGRLGLVAALTSTLEPTRLLLEQAARAAGVEVQVVEAPCLDAWALFDGGDVDGYLERIADHVRVLVAERQIDVVVLAQASMAPAVAMLSEVAVPVLASPRLAVERAAAVAAGRRRIRPVDQ